MRLILENSSISNNQAGQRSALQNQELSNVSNQKFKTAISTATLNDRRANQSSETTKVQASLSAIVDYLEDSFIPSKEAKNGLPKAITAERGNLQNAGIKMGIDRNQAESIDRFMRSVMDNSLTSVAVQKAETKQGAATSSITLKDSLQQLRPDESLSFTRSFAGTVKADFIGVPGAFPASETTQAKAPGITTAWVSPSATYAQENAVTVSRNSHGDLSIEFAKGHNLSAGAELGVFPFWADDSFAPPPNNIATSTAYGFFYGGGNLALGGAHNTSYSFDIDPNDEDVVISQLVDGNLNLDILTDHARSARAIMPSQQEAQDPEANQQQSSYTKTTVTTPVKVTIGGNVGGGLGVTPAKTIVPDKYALDMWVWPNLAGSVSSDVATQTVTERSGEEKQSNWSGPKSVDFTGTATPASLVFGHHVPKPGKEQFADDFWILQYPVSISATGNASVAVPAKHDDAGGSQFEINMDNPDKAVINQILYEAGVRDVATQEQILGDATGPDKAIKIKFAAPPIEQTGDSSRQENVPAENYRLQSISVSETKTTTASPLTLNPLSGNLDLAFVKKADQGIVAAKSNSALIEFDHGKATITYAGGMVSKPDEEVMDSIIDQMPATLRHRRRGVT